MRRAQVGVEIEEGRVGPDVRAVEGDEDRHVADELDALLVRVVAQPRPLAEEEVLVKLMGLLAFADGLGEVLRLGRVPGAEDDVPFAPESPAVVLLEGHEERKRLQPRGLGGTEVLKAGVARDVGQVLRDEAAVGEAQERPFAQVQGREVRPIPRQLAQGLQLAFLQQPRFQQRPEVDEVRVPGERTEARVRRVPEPGRPEGQDLPELDLAVGEEVDEAESRLAQGADAFASGQGSRVKQGPDSAGGEPIENRWGHDHREKEEG